MKKNLMSVALFAVLATMAVSCQKEKADQPEWVDLGLPSGLLWANRNVGASNIEDYGDYFSWGATSTTYTYNYSTYPYGEAGNRLTKYCNNPVYGLGGFTDTLVILVPEDDAATANLGNGARTPTSKEWMELLANTSSYWTSVNGVNGRKFTASNGNSIFLPAAGNRFGPEQYDTTSCGHYWSSSLYTDEPSLASCLKMYSYSPGTVMGQDDRVGGFSVRAVKNAKQIDTK